jgi:hypothetical protein
MDAESRDRRREQDRIGAELSARGDALSQRALDVTVPIFLESPDGEPEIVGSGLLVTLAADRFLFTATHVINLRERGQLAAGASPHYAGIAGEVWKVLSAGTKSGSDNDFIDVSVVQLRGAQWDEMPLTQFCAWNELDQGQVTQRYPFGVVGFPASKNQRPREGEHMKGYAAPFGALECDLEAYVAGEGSPM